ncbi:aminomethyl-transferring glycine dehydrogenase subunit GcvPA, partial [bacterium]|nr:aminomethyl-transferring glycine dehydrogenase subunit GcvPA [bacterium]
MDYIPHTPNETQDMLQFLGLSEVDELFNMIPESLKNPDIAFPAALTEMQITQHMESVSRDNSGTQMASFLGGGAYDHFVPKALEALISRGDFATAYTPYQAEASQGTLQAIYEFQSLMCRLTGLEVANASMYDGASALAEAALMACRVTRKEKVVISSTINPRYRDVAKTYLEGPGIELVEIPAKDGVTDVEWIQANIDDSVAAVFVQHPNYYGILEPMDAIGAAIKEKGSIFGAVVYPHSLGCLKPPASYGADIAVGDLQSLGLALNYGGPYAGFIASIQKFVRQLPGRLVGRTKDEDGKPAYVLTLQTREQHIRRSKATSNICTNQGLCALAATMYLALMGPKGLRQAAELSVANAHELQEQLCHIDGVQPVFDRPFFNEFLLELSCS